MDGYGQYCPIALAAEVFAERWTPIVLRNLMVGCKRFGEILDGAPGLPRSVLAQRLRSLERAGVVERRQLGRSPTYHLTECGAELAEVCIALGVWGARWREVRPEHHDPYLGLWTLSRLITGDALPRPASSSGSSSPTASARTATGWCWRARATRCARTTRAIPRTAR